MRLRPLLRIVLVAAALLVQAHQCPAYVSVALTNSDITDFTSGIANYWSTFTTGASPPVGLVFYSDSRNFRGLGHRLQGLRARLSRPARGFRHGCRDHIHRALRSHSRGPGRRELHTGRDAAEPIRRDDHQPPVGFPPVFRELVPETSRTE